MSTLTDERYQYRPGLIFLSRNTGHTVVLWPERYHVYPDGSREMIEPPGMAEFDLGLDSSQEFTPVDDQGEPVTTAPIMGMDSLYFLSNERAQLRGGAFDLDAGAAHYGWTDEQRATAAFKLLRMAHDPREGRVSLYEPKPPEAPWPTYDRLQNYLEIAKLADDLGLLDETVVYEARTKKRKGVLEALQARRQEHEAENALTAQ